MDRTGDDRGDGAEMIDFKFQYNGVTSLAAMGDALQLSAGAVFLISQLYHKGLESEKELFRYAIEHAVLSGFCWDDKHDVKGKGLTIDLSELDKQMEALDNER